MLSRACRTWSPSYAASSLSAHEMLRAWSAELLGCSVVGVVGSRSGGSAFPARLVGVACQPPLQRLGPRGWLLFGLPCVAARRRMSWGDCRLQVKRTKQEFHKMAGVARAMKRGRPRPSTPGGG